MTDRRRVNGPPGGTKPPVFLTSAEEAPQPLVRKRKPNELRKIFLKTGLVPSAAGSAYLELSDPSTIAPTDLIPHTSSLKLSCTIHGPKPLPRTASYSRNLQLSAHVKIAPFATRSRRGYVRDGGERDLSVHLETALKAVILAERYPKSAIDVVLTVLEAEEVGWLSTSGNNGRAVEGCGAMNVLAGCITVASAALADARIDCLDLVTGGVAITTFGNAGTALDPNPGEHDDIESACVVGYMPTRDEVTELWMKGDLPANAEGGAPDVDRIIDAAVSSAKGAQSVLQDAVKESAERYVQSLVRV